MLHHASASGQLLGCFRSIEEIVRFVAVFVQFLKNLALFVSEQGFVRSQNQLVPLKKKSRVGGGDVSLHFCEAEMLDLCHCLLRQIHVFIQVRTYIV